MTVGDTEIGERLRSLEGQVRAMVHMAERGESALALLEQAHTAQAAVARLSQVLLHHYVTHEQYGETYVPDEQPHWHEHGDTHHGHGGDE